MTGRKRQSGGAREGAGRPALTDEELRLRGARRSRPLKGTRADGVGDTTAAASAFDALLAEYFTTWTLPKEAPGDLWWPLFERTHPDHLGRLRRDWLRLRDVVCTRWRAATPDERRAWLQDSPAAAIASTNYPPAMWQFELLARVKGESEGAYR